MTNLNFGHTFKVLRLQKGYTLSDFKASISISQLSKFERNETEVTISKFFDLLKLLNVSLQEFLFIHNQFQMYSFETLVNNLKLYYAQENTEQLAVMVTEQMTMFQATNNFTFKLNAIMIRAVMTDISSVKVDQLDIDELTDYLWKVESWGIYELTLFGNSLGILPLESTVLFVKELAQKSVQYQKISSYKQMIYGIYFNTMKILLEQQRLEEGQYILKLLNHENIPEDFIFEKILLKYWNGLYLIQTHYEEGLELANEAIYCFNLVESQHLAKEYQKYLQTFITI